MLKFTVTKEDGDRVYFLGLDRRNVDRLTSGQPIKVNLADLGGPTLEVAIVFNETLRGLFDELKAAGVMPPGVEYTEPPPGEIHVTRVKQP